VHQRFGELARVDLCSFEHELVNFLLALFNDLVVLHDLLLVYSEGSLFEAFPALVAQLQLQLERVVHNMPLDDLEH